MKIGILTLPLHTNYGGILQAYALQTVLKRMGHEVYEIELKKRPMRSYPPLWKLPLSFTKRFILKYILRRKGARIFVERYENKIYPVLSQYTQRFIDSNISQLKVDRLADCRNKFDAFVCGSDQVWRYQYYPWFENDIANVYLKFLGDDYCKRIAYATSLGTEEWEYPKESTEECRHWIQKFQSVSVREASGKKLCAENFGVNAKHVLDPTMLLRREDYEALIEKEKTEKPTGNLFCYILDETREKMRVVEQVQKQRHLKPFFMKADGGNYMENWEKRILPPVEGWLRAFNDAEFVVTDSFHACVFSILFHKQFIVIGNRARGLARIDSLLSIFGLQDRLVSEEAMNINDILPIDYDKVDVVLEKWREKSMQFLCNSLLNNR